MNIKLCLAFMLLYGITIFGQTTEDVILKNQQLIEELRTRISAIEYGEVRETQVSKLKKIILIQNDSIQKLNALLLSLNEKKLNDKYSGPRKKAIGAEELNNDLRNNPAVLSQLGNCNCVRVFYNAYQVQIDYTVFKELDSLALVCKSNPDLKFNLLGHADKTGTEDENIMLSKKRVESLKTYLVDVKGINAKRIGIDWLGSSKPFIALTDETKQYLNRRVEVFIE